PGDYFTGQGGTIYEKLPYTTSNGGWKKILPSDIPTANSLEKKGIVRTDGTTTPVDLSNAYLQNLMNQQTGESLI